MFKRNKNNSPVKVDDGLSCHLMLQETDVRGDSLAVTWVDVEPGARQIPHRHSPEQVYVIVKGSGLMRVGDEEQSVSVGDIVYIPGNVIHGIRNTAEETLTYITAATPGFDIHAFYDAGQAMKKARAAEAGIVEEPELIS